MWVVWCLSFVRHSTYRPRFSSECDQIRTQHIFLKCLEVLFWIFWNFEFWHLFWPKNPIFQDLKCCCLLVTAPTAHNFHQNGTKFRHVFLKCLEVLFWNFRNFEFWPHFWLKKAFLRPKMVKIQDFFTDMPCYLSNQSIQPAHYFFELFSSEHAKQAQISSMTG